MLSQMDSKYKSSDRKIKNFYEKAKEIYVNMKDEDYPFNWTIDTYKEGFIQDLDELEANNIKHPDIPKARKLFYSYNEKVTKTFQCIRNIILTIM